MEQNFEQHSVIDDLLSQSYCIGIQNVAGIENAASNNFRVPEKLLDKRKKAWNNLFEKYSAMVFEAELNIHVLQPEDQINPCEVMNQHLPMRKPMSMVQYWVDTGNLVHTKHTNETICSNSESGVDEKDCSKPIQNIDSQSSDTHPSVENHSDIAETLGNKNLRIVTSSYSSIDTAAYILANNNVTKKAETIAIVEGSKVNTEKQNLVNDFFQIVETDKNNDQISLTKKCSSEKLNVENTNFSQSFFCKSYVDKISENIKNANFDTMCKSNMRSKSKQQENHICSIFFSDSDNSQISNVQSSKLKNLPNETSQNNNNLRKFLKRKRLFKRSDSPAEFTPVSEDNLSLKTSRLLLEKCLPLRKSEHPALETPRRFLSRTRFGGTKCKRKLNHQCFSLLSTTNNPKNKSHELFDPRQNSNIMQTVSKKNLTNNNPTLKQSFSEDDTPIKECNIQNSMITTKQSFSNQPNEVLKPFVHLTNTISSCNTFLKNKFKLKSCKVFVKRLSHKYFSIQRENITKNKNFLDTIKSEIANQDLDGNPCNYTLKSNTASTNNAANFSYPANTLPKNSPNITINDFNKLYNIKTIEDKFNHKETQQKLLDKKNSVHFSDKLKTLEMKSSTSNICPIEEISSKCLKMTNNENLLKKKSKYVIADSSSDESDLIVPLSNTINQSVGKLKNSKKLPTQIFSYKLPKHVKSKKEIQFLIGVENEEKFNTLSHENNSKICSNYQKNIVQNCLRNTGKDDDVQYNEIKESVYSNEYECKISPTDCNKQIHKVKKTLMLSSSEKETPMLTKKITQGVDLSIKCKKIAKSTNAILVEGKNITNSTANGQMLVHKFHQINKKEDKNKKLFERVTKRDQMNILNNTRNNKEVSISNIGLNNDNSQASGMLSNCVNEVEPPCRISRHINAENSPNIERYDELVLTKQIERHDKQQQIKEPVKVKTMITRNISTKKRKSFEIDLSSDEECIIPLKRKE